jgi:hypothetical protein
MIESDETDETDLVSIFITVKVVMSQLGWVAFDELDVAGLRKGEDGALLVADAAVAVARLLDLRQGDLVDKGRAMAVAAVGLEGCLLLSHFARK